MIVKQCYALRRQMFDQPNAKALRGKREKRLAGRKSLFNRFGAPTPVRSDVDVEKERAGFKVELKTQVDSLPEARMMCYATRETLAECHSQAHMCELLLVGFCRAGICRLRDLRKDCFRARQFTKCTRPSSKACRSESTSSAVEDV